MNAPTVDVLDHGFVRLVSEMRPYTVAAGHGWTGDLEVVRNARVSYDADERTGEGDGSDKKLLKYMYSHQHTSPFEAMVFTFEIKAPIFVIRQWHRHRTWSYNEVSARYTELPTEFYVPEAKNIGTQSKSNKQARDIGLIKSEDDRRQRERCARIMRVAGDLAFDHYDSLLASGVPRELARTVLPLSTYSRFFATVDLHNLMHFIRLRSDSHAQFEIQQYSNALTHLIRPVVPVIAELLITELENPF